MTFLEIKVSVLIDSECFIDFAKKVNPRFVLGSGFYGLVGKILVYPSNRFQFRVFFFLKIFIIGINLHHILTFFFKHDFL